MQGKMFKSTTQRKLNERKNFKKLVVWEAVAEKKCNLF